MILIDDLDLDNKDFILSGQLLSEALISLCFIAILCRCANLEVIAKREADRAVVAEETVQSQHRS